MRVPAVAELYLPKTLGEKKFTQQVVNKIPFDMIDAWREHVTQSTTSMQKHMPSTFVEIVNKNSINDREPFISSLLRHCIPNSEIVERPNPTELKDLVGIAKEFMPNLTPAEAGIILHCLIKLNYFDLTFYNSLLNRIVGKRERFSVYASIVALIIIAKQPQFQSFTLPVIEKIRSNISIIKSGVDLTKLAIGLSSFLHLPQKSLIIDIIKNLFIQILSSNQSFDLDDTLNLLQLATVMSRTGLLSAKVFESIYKKIENEADTLTFDDCAVFSNCISQLGHAKPAGTIKYFEILGDTASKLHSQINSRLASVMINSFARAHVLHQDLFMMVSSRLLDISGQMDSRQVAMLAHAFVKLGHLHNINIIWDMIGMTGNWTWQELAMLLQSYSKSGANNLKLLNNIYDNLTMQFNKAAHIPTGLASVAYSLYKCRQIDPSLNFDKLLIMISQKAITMLNKFKTTELANLCVSFSHSQKASSIILPHLKKLPLNNIEADSIYKIITFISNSKEEDSSVIAHTEWCSKLIRNNIHKVALLPISHKRQLVSNLSKMGVFDIDLNSIIYN